MAHDQGVLRYPVICCAPFALPDRTPEPLSLPGTPDLRGLAQRAQIPTQLSLSSRHSGKAPATGRRQKLPRDLDRASRAASEEQMTPSVTRGDATGRHADSTNSPICPAECSAGHAGTGNGLLAVARTRKAANGPLPGNHTGGSEHCQCHDTARRCRAPDARANKKRPPKRAPVQSGKSEGIKLRGWGPGRHPAGSHPRPCRRPQ